MPDMFRTVINYQFPQTTQMWGVLTRVVDYLSELLASRPGTMTLSEYRGADPQASTVSRASVPDLQSALRSHHIAVETVHVTLGVAENPSRPWDKAIGIELRVWFAGRSISSRVDVTVESTDKVVLMGLKAQIESELQLIAVDESASRRVEVHTPEHPADSRLAVPPRHTGGLIAARESTRGWVARTWRDHTATFIATTIGGLLVVVLGIWLGVAR